MKNRGYAVLIAVFFAGLIGLWWADHSHVLDRNSRMLAGTRVLPGMWEARPDDVRRIEIDGGPHRLAFERRPGNRWQMVEPIDVAADPSLVENLAANLKLLEKVPDAGTLHDKPASYGLAPPVRTVRIFGPASSEPTAVLEVGDLATNKDRRYVRPAGADGIEVVDSRKLLPVELPPEKWRDRSLVRMATFDVQALEAKRADGKALLLERGTDLWKLVGPFRAVADSGKVDGLLAEVTGLRVPEGGFVADDAHDLAPFGLDKPMLTLTVTSRGSGSAPQKIDIGGLAPVPDDRKAKVNGVRHYARRHDQNDVVVIDAGLIRDLGLHPTDLHAKKVADIDPGHVDAIRLTSEGTAVVAARGPKGWERIEPLRDRADSPAISEILKKVEAAQASELFDPKTAPDPQLDPPWAVLEIWQDSGLRTGEGSPSMLGTSPRLKLLLGRRDPIAKTVFARVDGDAVVLALPISFLEGFTYGSLAFRDRQVASVSPPQVERIEVVQGPRSVLVEAPRDGNPNAWRLKAPADTPADPETVGRALLRLADLRAESLITDRAGADAKFGLDTPALTVKWKTRDEFAPPPRRTIEGEETTLTVGSTVPGKPGPRYARISSSPIVFTIGPEIVALFEAEWRDRTVFAFNPKSADRITLRWPSLALNARPVPDAKEAEPDWSLADPPPGLKLDQSQLKPLAKMLSRLQTFRFTQHAGPIPAETGLFPAKLEVEVQPTGQVRPRVLRIGRTTPEGYLYATTEETPSGAVFLLPLSNWSTWLKLPEIEKAAAKGAPGTPKAATPAADVTRPK